ncbi:hypothetical protein [Spirochaeta cellobiosiphila]|uniref:hypothetical protein n=1 Tax=Spirochaeta cellobiosiphila TaxID=504483 RepID=UPI0003FD3AD2|nr:hypothetical protein [Spirochaeta cellobiosiphila]
MADKKFKLKYILLILTPLVIIGVFLFYNYVYTSYESYVYIPLDENQSITITTLNWKKRESKKYITLTDVHKGILWKYQIDRSYEFPSTTFIYEMSYRRDVMVKGNEISFMMEQDDMVLYKFNLRTGELIDQIAFPSPQRSIIPWAFLQDDNNLYCRTVNEKGQPCVKAIRFDDFEVLWEATLEDLQDKMWVGDQIPYQNAEWIILHGGDPKHPNIHVISKSTGQYHHYTELEIGVLKSDFYYYCYSLDEATVGLFELNLTTGESHKLYTLGDKDSGKSPLTNERSESKSLIWLYQDSLVYPYIKDDQAHVRSLVLDSGEENWDISFPPFYYPLTLASSRHHRSAPEYAFTPYIQVPHMIFILTEYGPDAPESQYTNTIHTMVNMDKGQIEWTSNPVLTYRYNLEDELEKWNHFQYPYYYLYLDIPNNKYDYSPSVLTINGLTGEILTWSRFGYKEKGQKNYLYYFKIAEDYPLRRESASLIPLGPTAFYDSKTGRIYGKNKRKYFSEDVRDKQGAVYGL